MNIPFLIGQFAHKPTRCQPSCRLFNSRIRQLAVCSICELVNHNNFKLHIL